MEQVTAVSAYPVAVQGFRRSRILKPEIRAARERCVRVQAASTTHVNVASGVIFEEGIVLTNWHVIKGFDHKIEINRHPAEVIHMDGQLDLVALVAKTRKIQRLRFLHEFCESHPVFYLGNPDEYNKSVGMGHISWISKNKIRASCTPGEGFSGSGVYCLQSGALIGIAIQGDGSDEFGCNFTLATPSWHVQPFAEKAVLNAKRFSATPYTPMMF